MKLDLSVIPLTCPKCSRVTELHTDATSEEYAVTCEGCGVVIRIPHSEVAAFRQKAERTLKAELEKLRRAFGR